MKIKLLPDILELTRTELRSRGDNPKYPISTLPKFNKKIWGLKEGLTIIGARTSQGKSSFVSQLAYDLALSGKSVLFLSLEMTEINIVERLFCFEASIDNYDLLRGRFKTDERIKQKWDHFIETMNAIDMTITCGIGKTFPELLKLVKITNPDVLVLDYIQSIRARAGEMREMINEYVRELRQLALEQKFVGIVCSQIGRAGAGDSPPSLHHLKESGTLEEHADTVILLHWPYHYDNLKPINDYSVIIAKQRNGRTGKHSVLFEPNFYRFSEWENEKETKRR